MAKILVIDDSSEDREDIRRILEQRQHEVIGAATFAPEMESLETVDALILDPCFAASLPHDTIAEIRQRRPRLPIIVVAVKGNEERVIDALQRGALSYVPKKLLADELPQTVREVLQAAHEHECIDRLLRRRSHLSCEFVLENDRDNLTAVVSHLQQLCAEFGLFTKDNELTRVGMALDEALANAMMHGNLEVSSLLRDEEGAEFEKLTRQRALDPHYATRRIHVTAHFSRDGAEFMIADEGPGFDPAALADPTDAGNLELVSGRGVLLMRTFMDEVAFNKKGNSVTMKKKWPSA